MKLTKFVTFSCAIAVLAAVNLAEAKTERKPDAEARPPQFVILAFDGSLSNDFWTESVDFADTVSANTLHDSKKLRFTYFVNPVYYLDSAKKSRYSTPALGKPVSCIGWSNGRDAIVPRIDRTNRAYAKGHEIGSHANSHCDASGQDRSNPLAGRTWGFNEWDSEFNQFNDLLFNAYSINGLRPSEQYPKGWLFDKREIIGFRAPLLAYTDGLWPALKKHNFKYDTSKQAPPTYWPERMAWGGWNFPLARIKVAGTSKTTLSMDYNWLCFQSACASKPGLTEQDVSRFKTQMLDSYKYYFKINYFGARAPIHIGHHFSKWNGGAYWQGMKEFAKFVCSKPEVRCVTYKEYVEWLENLSPAQYQAFRRGDFDKLRDDNTIKNISTPVLAEVRVDMRGEAFEAVFDSDKDKNLAKVTMLKPQLSVNFEKQANLKISKADLITKVGAGKTAYVRASLVNPKGVEVNWQTYRIDKIGTPEETLSGALEDLANQGEGIDAHRTPEVFGDALQMIE